MFTGIITDLGRVRRLRRAAGPDGGLELTIATNYDTAGISNAPGTDTASQVAPALAAARSAPWRNSAAIWA